MSELPTCDGCDRAFKCARGCSITTLELVDGSIAARVPYGDEPFLHHYDPAERCPDCGAKMGEQHHVGCDMESCPSCGRQLLGCGHGEAYPNGIQAWV